MKRTPRAVFESLVEQAWVRCNCGSPDDLRYRDCIRRGVPLPDRLLPGRLVLGLPAEDREALAGLTAKDTQDRMGE